MIIYFVRHGESSANLLHEFSNSGENHPLTEGGISQVHALAERLNSVKFDRIYTSPVLRARQTAQILSSRLNAPLAIHEALREWDVGIYEGTADPHGWALHAQVQQDWFVDGRLDSKMPGGESFNEIQGRFIPFIQELLAGSHPDDETLILVAHGGLYQVMLPVILENVSYDFATRQGFPYTGCVIAESRPGKLHCKSWCGEALAG